MCNQLIRTVGLGPINESVTLPKEQKPPNLFEVGLLWLVRFEVFQYSIQLLIIEISQLAKNIDPENVNVELSPTRLWAAPLLNSSREWLLDETDA